MRLVGAVSAVFEHHKQRVVFLYAIIDMFREIVLDIHEFGEIDQDFACTATNALLHMLHW